MYVKRGGGGEEEVSVSSCSNIYMIGDTAHPPPPPPTHTYSIIYNMIAGKLNRSVELHICERRGGWLLVSNYTGICIIRHTPPTPPPPNPTSTHAHNI